MLARQTPVLLTVADIGMLFSASYLAESEYLVSEAVELPRRLQIILQISYNLSIRLFLAFHLRIGNLHVLLLPPFVRRWAIRVVRLA